MPAPKSKLKPTDYEYTLQEVAEELGVCRERVRQIESQALKKLKAALEAKGLGPSVLDCFDDSGTVQWMDQANNPD